MASQAFLTSNSVEFKSSQKPRIDEMRAFILLSFFAVAKADVAGYSYGIGPNGGYITGPGNGAESKRNEAISGINGGPAGGLFDPSFGGSSGDTLRGGLTAPSSDSLRGSHNAPSRDSFHNSNSGPINADYDAGFGAASNNAPFLNNGFNKEFFTFSAPESDFAASEPIADYAQSLKKNLRVIFIRSPENQGLNHAALNLAKQASEQKTAIYVLTKQPDVSELANRLQHINSNINNKPEVHFVKYRTPEDAANAQRAIQQQYDNLGGFSHSHDGGVAPVLNFASKGPAYNRGSDILGNDNGGFGSATTNTYIPPTSNIGSSSSPSATYLPIKGIN